MIQKHQITTARSAFSVSERDPLTCESVELQVFQDEKTGRYFAIDQSFMIDEEPHVVRSPFGHSVELVDDFDE